MKKPLHSSVFDPPLSIATLREDSLAIEFGATSPRERETTLAGGLVEHLQVPLASPENHESVHPAGLEQPGPRESAGSNSGEETHQRPDLHVGESPRALNDLISLKRAPRGTVAAVRCGTIIE